MHRYKRMIWLLALLGWCEMVTGQLRLPRLMSDHMVLQRDVEIPLLGQATPGERLTIVFQGKTQQTKAGKDGKWAVRLPASGPGGPFDLLIRGKRETLEVRDILVGDVWICSGQSNMEWTVAESRDAAAEMAGATDASIRHFKVPRSASVFPQDTLAGGAWVVCSPETAGAFTAVGYFFARELRGHEDIPIGLINTSWGGSRIEPWMDATSLGYQRVEDAAAFVRRQQEQQRQRVVQILTAKLGDLPEKEDLGMPGGQARWSDPGLDDTGWATMPLPGPWEQYGWEALDGVVWFRREIDLNEEQAATKAFLGLAMIDDSDKAWVNGIPVGGMTMQYNAVRRYEVPAGLLRPGRNVIAVRAEDTGGGGGIYGDPSLLYLETGKGKIDLSGPWKYRIGQVMITSPATGDNKQPTKLYNSMIHPLLGFPVKGFLWYQGEGNANDPVEATVYREQFKTMITRWRNLWGLGDLPFLFVQLANFRLPPARPGPSNWALLRESQSAALDLPNTAQAVIIDIGEAGDIHPRNKQDVGYRLALAARKLAYGEKNLVYAGPAYQGMVKEGAKIRIRFSHTGSGLMAMHDKYNYLKGFAIAGADRRFVWAQALIEGDEVVVWSETIPDPVAVRYAWADNPDDANLYNREGLPASPFRTDDWQE